MTVVDGLESLRAYPSNRLGDSRSAALSLLGCWLVRGQGAETCAGRITETEAYLSSGDPSSHAHSGPTRRNAVMFGPAGRAYVYRIYGLHHCMNVVTGPPGVGEAVLIRALEPRIGLGTMRERRGLGDARELCSGPGKLVQALGIEPGDDGALLCTTRGAGPRLLRAAGPGVPLHRVRVSRRVGITKAAGLALRFRMRAGTWTSPAR